MQMNLHKKATVLPVQFNNCGGTVRLNIRRECAKAAETFSVLRLPGRAAKNHGAGIFFQPMMIRIPKVFVR